MVAERKGLMATFGSAFHFKESRRPYQQRILDDSAEIGCDRKNHIAAALGARKTTLGLELSVRRDTPTRQKAQPHYHPELLRTLEQLGVVPHY